MSTEMPLEKKPVREGKSAIFGTASLVFAMLTILLPVVMMLIFGGKADHEQQSKPYGDIVAFFLVLVGLFVSVIVSGLSGVVGTIVGIVALVRGERSLWRPIVGLFVNVPVALLFLLLVVVGLVSRGS